MMARKSGIPSLVPRPLNLPHLAAASLLESRLGMAAKFRSPSEGRPGTAQLEFATNLISGWCWVLEAAPAALCVQDLKVAWSSSFFLFFFPWVAGSNPAVRRLCCCSSAPFSPSAFLDLSLDLPFPMSCQLPFAYVFILSTFSFFLD